MADDFLELGMEGMDKLVDRHFHKVPDKYVDPKTYKIHRHRHGSRGEGEAVEYEVEEPESHTGASRSRDRRDRSGGYGHGGRRSGSLGRDRGSEFGDGRDGGGDGPRYEYLAPPAAGAAIGMDTYRAAGQQDPRAGTEWSRPRYQGEHDHWQPQPQDGRRYEPPSMSGALDPSDRNRVSERGTGRGRPNGGMIRRSSSQPGYQPQDRNHDRDRERRRRARTRSASMRRNSSERGGKDKEKDKGKGDKVVFGLLGAAVAGLAVTAFMDQREKREEERERGRRIREWNREVGREGGGNGGYERDRDWDRGGRGRVQGRSGGGGRR